VEVLEFIEEMHQVAHGVYVLSFDTVAECRNFVIEPSRAFLSFYRLENLPEFVASKYTLPRTPAYSIVHVLIVVRKHRAAVYHSMQFARKVSQLAIDDVSRKDSYVVQLATKDLVLGKSWTSVRANAFAIRDS
jgi:hypothetical protein